MLNNAEFKPPAKTTVTAPLANVARRLVQSEHFQTAILTKPIGQDTNPKRSHVSFVEIKLLQSLCPGFTCFTHKHCSAKVQRTEASNLEQYNDPQYKTWYKCMNHGKVGTMFDVKLDVRKPTSKTPKT